MKTSEVEVACLCSQNKAVTELRSESDLLSMSNSFMHAFIRHLSVNYLLVAMP